MASGANLTPAQRYRSNTATGAVNTLTIAALSANTAWKLEKLVISVSAQPAWLTSPNLQIKDGNTVLWSFDLPPVGSSGFILDIPLPGAVSATNQPSFTNEVDGIVGTVGNAMSIVVASPQGAVKTIINAKVGVAYPSANDGSVIGVN